MPSVSTDQPCGYANPRYQRTVYAKNLYRFHADTSTPAGPGVEQPLEQFQSRARFRFHPTAYEIYPYRFGRDTSTPATTAADVTASVSVIVYPDPAGVAARTAQRLYYFTHRDTSTPTGPGEETPQSFILDKVRVPTVPFTAARLYYFATGEHDLGGPEAETAPSWRSRPLRQPYAARPELVEWSSATDVDVPAAPEESGRGWVARALRLSFVAARAAALYYFQQAPSDTITAALTADVSDPTALRVIVYPTGIVRPSAALWTPATDFAAPEPSAVDAVQGIFVVTYPAPPTPPRTLYHTPATDVAPAVDEVETAQWWRARTLPSAYQPPTFFSAYTGDQAGAEPPVSEAVSPWVLRAAWQPYQPSPFLFVWTPSTDIAAPAVGEAETALPWRARTLPLAYQPPTFFSAYTGDQAGVEPPAVVPETMLPWRARTLSTAYQPPTVFSAYTGDQAGVEPSAQPEPETAPPWRARWLRTTYQPPTFFETYTGDQAGVEPPPAQPETGTPWRARWLRTGYQPPTFFETYTGDQAGTQPAPAPAEPEANPHFAGGIIRSEYDASPWLYWMGSGLFPEEAEGGHTWRPRPLPNAFHPQPHLFILSRDTATPDAGGAETLLSWAPTPLWDLYRSRPAILLYTLRRGEALSAPAPPPPTARRRKTPQWMRREELLGVRW